jgi:SAM-dependent methyltransferase
VDGVEDHRAASANVAAFGDNSAAYLDGAPHARHPSLRALFAELLIRVFASARERSESPRVLDLGAGEGFATLTCLELGARVTAVDTSAIQLASLRREGERFGESLEVRCEDVSTVLRTTGDEYDIVVASSFLHHVPDYLGLLAQAVAVLGPRGQILTFQDPLRYDSVGTLPQLFCDLAYMSWRFKQGDVVGGLRRRLRRRRGLYLADSVHDNAEYHVTRNGVDQGAICRLLGGKDMEAYIVPYFSTQSPSFQKLGSVLGVRNTFAVVAQRRAS